MTHSSEGLLDRLTAAAKPRETWDVLVLAALDGPETLEAALRNEAVPQRPKPQPEPTREPAGAYLKAIAVEGFRGIGPQAVLDLVPGPGLTLVVGRNGSGKSSFAEALELLLTGDTFRWAHRTKVWREGWRNLHHKLLAILGLDDLVAAQEVLKDARTSREKAQKEAGELRKRIVEPAALGRAHACSRTVTRGRDRLAFGARGFEPRGLRPLDLGKRLGRRRSKSRAGLEVGDVGDVTTVLVAPEDVDVVVLHGPCLRLRLYRSTSVRTCLTWYGLHLPSTSLRSDRTGPPARARSLVHLRLAKDLGSCGHA